MRSVTLEVPDDIASSIERDPILAVSRIVSVLRAYQGAGIDFDHLRATAAKTQAANGVSDAERIALESELLELHRVGRSSRFGDEAWKSPAGH